MDSKERNGLLWRAGYLFAHTLSRHFSASKFLPVIAAIVFGTPGQQALAAVGGLPGDFSISPSGAAIYSIPIDVPPGIAGMQPSLALVYNSQAGNGVVGVGWSLSGLSAITRCPQTLVQDDGHIHGVDYTAEDRFCLDGKRLISINGDYGAPGTEYRTEIDGFSKIVSNGTAGSGPNTFTVRTKAGQILTYARPDGMQVDGPGNGLRYWLLKKVADTAGNYFTITYSQDSGANDYNPDKIEYASTVISFSYETRSDPMIGYRAGIESAKQRRLSKITATTGGLADWDYRLTYGYGGAHGLSVLQSVQKCAGSQCLEPTVITTQDRVNGFSSPESWGLVTGPDKLKFADVDGDGRLDAVVVSEGVSVNTYLATSNGYTSGVTSNINVCAASQAALQDVDGDGRADLICVTSDGKATVWLSVNNRYDNSSVWNAGLGVDSIDKVRFADFNGDGRIDIMRMTDMHVWMSNGNAFVDKGTWGAWPQERINFPLYLDQRRFVEDFNNDGMADIVYIRGNQQLTIWFSTGAGFADPVNWGIEYSGPTETCDSLCTTPSISPIVGDYNGDGLPDIAAISKPQCDYNNATCSTFMDIWISTGSGFIHKGEWSLPYTWSSGLQAKAADITGDGKAEIIDFRGDNAHVWSITDSGPIDQGQWATGVRGPASNIFTDIDGDGRIDIVGFYSSDDDVPITVWRQKAGAQPDLVNKIVSSGDNEIRINYLPLADQSVYTPYTDASYPKRDLQAPMYVVASVQRNNGIGGFNKSTYTYEGGKIQAKGRGFLGFAKTTATDNASGSATTTTYSQDFPFAGLETEVVTSIDGVVTDSRTTTYIDVSSNKAIGIHSPQIKTSTEDTYDLVNGTHLAEITTTYSGYGEYGNVGKVDVTTTDKLSKESWETTTENTFDNNVGSWILGRLISSTVTHQGSGQTVTKSSAFEYNSDGLLTRETIEPNANDLSERLDTTYQYDAYGYKTSTSVQGWTRNGSQMTARVTQAVTTFPESGIRQVVITNAKGHQETRLYSMIHGGLKSLVGPNNLETTWTYDKFGRKTREDRPDGTWTTWTMAWATDEIPNASYKVTTATSGAAPAVVYKDSLGREIREVHAGMDGRSIYMDTQYNGLGRVSGVSRPYYADESSYWTKFTYDALGRVTRQDAPGPDGGRAVTNTAYSGHTKTVTTSSSKKTVVGNALGKTERVEEGWGSSWVDYQYTVTGALASTTDSLGQVTRLSYDLRGRKISMDDPAMGHWDYRYNSFGELEWQRDAKGQQVTLSYDSLGRLTRRAEAEGVSTWQYDTAANGIGKIAVVTGPGGYSEQQQYDTLGRPTISATSYMGSSYNVTTGYDGVGRVSWVKQPDGFLVKNVYNQFGYLTAVRSPIGQVGDYDLAQLQAQFDAVVAAAKAALYDANRYAKLADYYLAAADIYDQIRKDIASADPRLAMELAAASQQLKDLAEQIQSSAAILSASAANQLRTADNIAQAAQESGVYSFKGTYYQVMEEYYRDKSALTTELATDYIQLANNTLNQAALLDSDPSGSTLLASKYLSLANQKITTAAKFDANAEEQRALAETYTAQSALIQQNLDDTNNAVWWRADQADAEGRVTRELYGNGVVTYRDYDGATGQLLTIKSGSTGLWATTEYKGSTATSVDMLSNVQSHSYVYDERNNVIEHTDDLVGTTTGYQYDGRDRLLKQTVNDIAGGAPSTKTWSYDSVGNITFQTGVGSYSYGQAGTNAHALLAAGGGIQDFQYDANGNVTRSQGRTFEYTSYNKPWRLAKGTEVVGFNYGPDRSRYYKTESRADGSQLTTLYIGKLYEQVATTRSGIVTTERKHYIYAGGALIAVYNRKTYNGVTSGSTNYLHRDALGSVDAITDAMGRVVARYRYDAFGKRTAAALDDPLHILAPVSTTRGYTGHEHVEELGLIHMNGRVYDPVVARFLSPDSIIQAPENTQNYNRYSYAVNNPLKYTDPSGHAFGVDDVVLAVYAYAFAQSSDPMFNFVASTMFMMLGASAGIYAAEPEVAGFYAGYIGSGGDIRGGIVGAVTVSAYTAVGDMHLTGLAKVVAHGVVGGLSSAGMGGKFQDGFLGGAANAVSGLVGDEFNLYSDAGDPQSVLQNVMVAAVLGGTASRLAGGNFANGARSAAFARLFNDQSHSDLRENQQETMLRENGDVYGYYTARAARGDAYAVTALRVVLDDGYVIGPLANFRLAVFAYVYSVKYNSYDVNILLMDAHGYAVNHDTSSRPGLLSARQITAYHYKVFEDLGLPTATFGGTFFNMEWEADVEGALIWCRGCDIE